MITNKYSLVSAFIVTFFLVTSTIVTPNPYHKEAQEDRSSSSYKKTILKVFIGTTIVGTITWFLWNLVYGKNESSAHQKQKKSEGYTLGSLPERTPQARNLNTLQTGNSTKVDSKKPVPQECNPATAKPHSLEPRLAAVEAAWQRVDGQKKKRQKTEKKEANQDGST